MNDPFEEERPRLPWTTFDDDEGVTDEELELQHRILAYLQAGIGAVLLGLLVYFQ